MTSKINGLMAFTVGAMMLQPSISNAVDTFVWKDGAGLVPAKNCSVVKIEDTGLRVVEGVKGKPAPTLPDGSLVKLADDSEKDSLQQVRVLGLPPGTSLTERKAAVKEDSLKEIGDVVLEAKNQALSALIAGSKASGTLWQAATEGDRYLGLRCVEGNSVKTFTLFNVFKPGSISAIAIVGVDAEQSQLAPLRNLRVLSIDDAEAIVKGKPQAQERGRPGAVVPAGVPQITPGATGTAPIISRGRPSTAPALIDDTNKGKPANPPSAIAPKAPSPQTQKNSPTLQRFARDYRAGQAPMISLNSPAPTGVPVVNGSAQFVVCISDNGLQVRDESLTDILFSVKKDEVVKPMQSWSANKVRKTIRGKTYTFIKAQFPEQSDENNVGWVAEQFVKQKSACATYSRTESNDATDDETEETEVATKPATATGPITGLNSEACCVFPTIKRPTDSYMQGMRRFGAGRGRGSRLHAAADLYRYHGEVFEAVAPGRVIRNRYYFYQGTFALEVKHVGGFVVRYGEITGREVAGAQGNAQLRAGQQIGYISTVNSGCCSPMLHFELYSGTMGGPLRGGGSYQRRADLMNPSQYLRKWEKMRFGASY